MESEEQKQITEAFMKDFLDLLRKYDACFDSDYDSWESACVVDIDFHIIYDEKGNMLRPPMNFRLPNYIDSRAE